MSREQVGNLIGLVVVSSALVVMFIAVGYAIWIERDRDSR